MFKTVHAFSTFAVKDLKKAKQFYAKTLGIKVTEDKKMGLLYLELGKGARVMIYPKPDQKPANNTILTLVVKDIDKTVAELAKHRVKPVIYKGFGQDKKGIVRANEYGPSITWFKDPSGNIIAAIED